MRNGIVASMVFVAGYCCAARAEVYEIPLPVTGVYPLQSGKEFTIDLGVPVARINDLRLRLEGSVVAPWASGPFDPAGPYDAFFEAYIFGDAGGFTRATSPGAGKATYPEPELLVAEIPFSVRSWSALEDGVASASFGFGRLFDFETRNIVGGSGTITGAWLIIDATPVPEPAFVSLASLLLLPLLGKRPPRG